MTNQNEYSGEIIVGGIHIATNLPAGCRVLALQSCYYVPFTGTPIGTLEVALTKLGINFDLITTPYPYVPNVFTPLFNAVNFNDYDVIVVGWAGDSTPAQEVTDALNGRKTELQNWINCGGGLVVLSQFRLNNIYDYLPFPVGSVRQYANDVNIVMAGHPVMNGLTSALLSNWGASRHNYFSSLDDAYEVLCTNDNEDPITVVATSGGRIVLTGQDADWHYGVENEQGAGMLLDNMICWACRTQNLCRGVIL